MSQFETIHTGQAQSFNGRTVAMHGHIARLKNLGQLIFLTLRDARGTIQLVAEGEEVLAVCKTLVVETPVIVTGMLRAAPESNQTEMALESIRPLTGQLEPPPVEIAKQSKIDKLSPGALFDMRPLTLRNPKVRAIFKIQAEILVALRQYLNQQGFVEIHSPKLVSTGTEGGANVFSLEYFGKTAYLAQSPQFYKQIMVGVFERVFEVGPVYRAEEHDTTRHLNEYISLDFEMGFIQSMQDLIQCQEGLLRHIFAHLSSACATELAMYQATVPEITAIPQLTLAQAREILQSQYNWQSASRDLDPEGERLICQYTLKEHGSSMVYITNYPSEVRPFYAMKDSSGTGTESFDLLYNGLEITTGGQRIHRYEDLVASIQSRGMKAEEFSDYLLAFKHGMPPHGGLGIGLERLVKQLLGLASVKQAALFPRDQNRLTP